MATTEIHDGNTDGITLGRDASDKVGFHGVTPVVQQARVADATDAATAITSLNSVIDVLIAYGMMASA